jgi:hypothetical protein
MIPQWFSCQWIAYKNWDNVTCYQSQDFEMNKMNYLHMAVPMQQCLSSKHLILRIWGFHSGGYEEYHLLGYDAV